MKRVSRSRTCLGVVLLSVLSLTGVGCNQEIIRQITALTGSYLGDLASVLATSGLETALGVTTADAEADAEHEHAHTATPLNEYEH